VSLPINVLTNGTELDKCKALEVLDFTNNCMGSSLLSVLLFFGLKRHNGERHGIVTETLGEEVGKCTKLIQLLVRVQSREYCVNFIVVE